MRQLNATNDGSFYDLNIFVEDGMVGQHDIDDSHVEAVTWGDIHVDQLSSNFEHYAVSGNSFIYGKPKYLTIEDHLKPKHQFFHDILDFRSRSHHDEKNPHKSFYKFINHSGNVHNEIYRCAGWFLDRVKHGVSDRYVIVASNHIEHLERWLREADYRDDPENALFFLRLQAEVYEAIANGRNPNVLFEAFKIAGPTQRQKELYG